MLSNIYHVPTVPKTLHFNSLAFTLTFWSRYCYPQWKTEAERLHASQDHKLVNGTARRHTLTIGAPSLCLPSWSWFWSRLLTVMVTVMAELTAGGKFLLGRCVLMKTFRWPKLWEDNEPPSPTPHWSWKLQYSMEMHHKFSLCAELKELLAGCHNCKTLESNQAEMLATFSHSPAWLET